MIYLPQLLLRGKKLTLVSSHISFSAGLRTLASKRRFGTQPMLHKESPVCEAPHMPGPTPYEIRDDLLRLRRLKSEAGLDVDPVIELPAKETKETASERNDKDKVAIGSQMNQSIPRAEGTSMPIDNTIPNEATTEPPKPDELPSTGLLGAVGLDIAAMTDKITLDEELNKYKEEEAQNVRYYQYFNTYQVFDELKEGGFDDEQAHQMVGIIGDMVKDKIGYILENYFPMLESDNEAYLFEAACSELRTEVQKMREADVNTRQLQIDSFQKDMEEFEQDVNSLLIDMRNNIDILLSERKNENDEVLKHTDIRIQEVNNSIVVDANHRMKPVIEEFRWVLMRNGLVLIFSVAVMLLGTLYLWRVKTKFLEEEKRRAEEVDLNKTDLEKSMEDRMRDHEPIVDYLLNSNDTPSKVVH
ncbi:hypothetical protein CKK34_2626 [Yarrowia sp. E02]|nr:hypothetical protein CKK34_2626 [Yarrowia sp. E02]